MEGAGGVEWRWIEREGGKEGGGEREGERGREGKREREADLSFYRFIALHRLGLSKPRPMLVLELNLTK